MSDSETPMARLVDTCERVIRWGLVGLLAFTPFAFGTVEPWAVAIMEWGIVSLALLFGLSRLWSTEPGETGTFGRTGLEVPLSALALLVILQVVPLPLPWLRAIAPGSARLYTGPDVRSVVDGIRPALEPGPAADILGSDRASWRFPVSITPGQTVAMLLLLGCLVLVFLVVAAWADRRERIVFLTTAITVIGTLVALQGLIQFLTWNGRIFWFRKIPAASSFGPFVNHNHFAGYVEMILPLSISLAFYIVESRGRPSESSLLSRVGWAPAALSLFSAVMLLSTLLLSLSRGGILASFVSGGMLALLMLKRVGSRAPLWGALTAVLVLTLGLILWIGADPLKRQMGTYAKMEGEASFHSRIVVWHSVMHHLADYAWLGAGLGAFEQSFAPYTPSGTEKRWDRAHNDYLQILWETGLVGALLVASTAFIFIRRYWWPALRAGTDALDPFRLGVATALMSIALHSIVDFNLQIAANGFLFAVLAALLVSLRRLGNGEQAALAGGPSEAQRTRSSGVAEPSNATYSRSRARATRSRAR